MSFPSFIRAIDTCHWLLSKSIIVFLLLQSKLREHKMYLLISSTFAKTRQNSVLRHISRTQMIFNSSTTNVLYRDIFVESHRSLSVSSILMIVLQMLFEFLGSSGILLQMSQRPGQRSRQNHQTRFAGTSTWKMVWFGLADRNVTNDSFEVGRSRSTSSINPFTCAQISVNFVFN